MPGAVISLSYRPSHAVRAVACGNVPADRERLEVHDGDVVGAFLRHIGVGAVGLHLNAFGITAHRDAGAFLLGRPIQYDQLAAVAILQQH